MRTTLKGWVNIHIDRTTLQMFISKKPYESKEEAEKGIFIGLGIEKVACLEIEWEGNQIESSAS